MNDNQFGSRGKGPRRILGLLLLIVISTLIPLFLLEVVLRIYPVLISEPVLVEFPKSLRREIAIRLGLPVKQARRCIPSSERYDRGPELCIAYPDFQWIQKVDDIDKQYGAQEQITQDANGFCNVQSKAERSHNDILFIGDSFTWCWTLQPEKTFSALLENALDQDTYNIAFPGIGPYEYVEILKRFGLQYSPKLVVMNIYEGNDLRDGMRYWKSVQENTPREKASDKQPDGSDDKSFLFSRLLDSSYSLNFISAAVEATDKRFFRDTVNFHYQVRVGDDNVPMNVTNSDRDEVKNAHRLSQGEVDLDVWKEALVEFLKLARTHQFIPVVTYIPSAYTAYSESVVFEDSDVGQDVAFLSSMQRKHLAALAAELDFFYFDLTPDLQKAVLSGTLAYFPGNVHLTERGHGLIAEALVPQLESLLASAGLDDENEAADQSSMTK